MLNTHYVQENKVKQLTNNKGIKNAMVVATYAVIQPLAMVIESANTFITNVTMSTIFSV